MTEDQIKFTVNPDEQAIGRLGSRLRKYNRSRVPQDPTWNVLLTIEDDAGELMAGLYGHVSYTWLFVEVVWVAEQLRRQGCGTRLLKRAEEHAREHGCYGVWLDTFSFQARGFYEKQGYTLFGELPNYPGEHSRFFMSKKLN
jgi:GNAT superfamily N-acetyltransferase